MDRGFSYGKMGKNMKGSGGMAASMDRAYGSRIRETAILDNGTMGKCKGRGFILVQMAKGTKEAFTIS